MANIIPLKESSGAQFYPQTHEKAVVDSNGVTLASKLANISAPSYVVAWDGNSTPVVANIPAGVTFTYSGNTYTGTLAASSSTVNKTYLVYDNNGNFDEYITQVSGSTYSWVYLGNTSIDLSSYVTQEEFSQLDQEINGGTFSFVPAWQRPGYYLSTSGVPTAAAQWNISSPFMLVKGEVLIVSSQGASACIIAQTNDGETYTPLVNAPGTATGLKSYVYVAQEDINVAVSVKWALNDVEISKTTEGLSHTVYTLNEKVNDISTGKYYGYYAAAASLPASATVDGFAYVGSGPTYTIYNCVSGVWTSSGVTVNQSPIGNGEDINQDAEGKLQFAPRAYNSSQPNVLGYKIIRNDATFAEQVTNTNTIYEIRYDFDLASAFAMPAECVLRFVGGSISGAGTLTFADTVVEGDAKITCGIAGTIDGVVNIGWFGLKNNDSTFDNGAVINKVAAVFKKIYLPVGTYYITTPILLQNMEQLLFDGLIWYKGTTDDTAAVTLQGSNGTFIFKGRISGYQNTAINYAGFGATTIRGLEIQNCNNSLIYVWSVKDFNEALRVSSPSTGGCSYNTFILGELVNANKCIRIFQNNGGWCNENHFIGGRLYCESNWTASGRFKVAVYIAGPGTASDTYDSCNALAFSDMSMEGFSTQNYVIYARKLTNSSFKQIRTEGLTSKGQFIKFVNACFNNIVEISYGSQNLINDFSESTRFPFKMESLSCNLIKKISVWDFKQDYTDGNPTAYWITPDTVFNARSTTFTRSHVSSSFSESGGVRTVSNYPVCVVLDCTKVKTFYVKANKKVRFVVWYLEDTNGNTISGGDTQKDYRAPCASAGQLTYNSSVYCYNSGSDELENTILIPDDSIAKVVIGCKGTFDEFSVFALGGVVTDEYFPALVTQGPTASRPTRRPRGFQYFDEDLLKWIMWNGTAWVNMDGSDLSVLIVADITALSSTQLDALNPGGVVVKQTGNQFHAYIVSYKGNGSGEGLCLTYADASTVETVSYDRTESGWVYNSTDITPLPINEPSNEIGEE